MRASVILIALAFSALAGCVEHVPKEKKEIVTKRVEYVFEEGEKTLEVWEIDGCEYLYGPWGNATVLTHKGNCKNHMYK